MSELFGVPVEYHPASVVALVTALMLGMFSVLVGALGRFKGAAAAYALFGLGFGLTAALSNVTGFLLLPHRDSTFGATDWSALSPRAVAFYSLVVSARLLAAVLFTVGIVRLLVHYGVTSLHRRPWLWATAAVVLLRFFIPGPHLDTPGLTDIPVYASSLSWASDLITWLPFAMMIAGPMLLAQAAVVEKRDGQAILAAAIGAYGWLAYVFVGILFLPANPVAGTYWATIGLYAFIAGASAWWWARERTGIAMYGRIPLFATAAFVTGILMGWYAPNIPASGIARSLEILLVAYAILRYQYLGLDIKVRWGISKTTIAAVFVAVFFIASEAAQVFFGGRFNDEYIGIAAAGALVFAIAPIMRIADTFAAKAVPAGPDNAEAVYLAAFRTATADGRISPAEEVHLAEVAERLGLGPRRVAELRLQETG